MTDRPGHSDFVAGVHAIGARDIKEALRHFTKACALAPRQPRYQLYRAWARHQTLRSSMNGAKALKASCRITILHALNRDKRFDAGYVLLGTILLGDGQHDRARDCFYKAIALNPDNAGAKMGIEAISKGRARP